MFRISLAVLLLIGMAQAQAQDKILIPEPPVQRPIEGTPTVLTSDLIYLVRFTQPVIVLASPDGIVKVTAETGPMKIRGHFVDAPDKVETRTFTDKFIYQVEAKATGRCELLVFPANAPDSKALVRRLIDSQNGPLPPPKPPDPAPPVPVNPLSAKLQAALVADSAPAGTAAKLSAVYLSIAGGVNDPSITTYSQLASAASALQNAAVPPSSVPAFRAAVSSYLTGQFGTDGGKAIDRPLAASTFTSLSTALVGGK